jgi:alginate O-acetyltransferase complex protein AlgI
LHGPAASSEKEFHDLQFVEPFFLFVVLPTTLCAFYLAGRHHGPLVATAVLVGASAIFYAPYGSQATSLLAASLLMNIAIGGMLSHYHLSRWLRTALLGAGLFLNFLALATFKYVDQVAELISPSAGPVIGVAIPAGISFYTFHQSVFLLDAYNRKTEVLRFLKGTYSFLGKLSAFTRYAAFVALFPQLVIGPITYMSEVGPQLQRQSFGRLRIVDLQVGATLIVVGLFKKLCIADPLGDIVNAVYRALPAGIQISQTDADFAVIGYFFQLYFDFSGYSDIALGIARLFGIYLPINFDSPLRATGISDFYRRWHITLTRVIALFLFTPLSLWGARSAMRRGYTGWRHKALAVWLPLLANFQIIALWHGANGTFILFGAIHGAWYIMETEIRASRAFALFRSKTSDRFRTIGGMAVTTLLLALTFALFRSRSLAEFGDLLSRLAAFDTIGSAVVVPTKWYWVLVAAIAAIVYLLPNVYEISRYYRPGIVTFVNPSTTPGVLRAKWRPDLLWALFVAALAAGVFMRIHHPSHFLYAGF